MSTASHRRFFCLNRKTGKRDRSRRKRRGDDRDLLGQELTKSRPSAKAASIVSLDTVMTPVEISVQMDDEIPRSKVNVVRVNADEKPGEQGNPGIKSTTEQEIPEKKIPKSKKSLGGVRVVKMSKDEVKERKRSSAP